MKKIMKIAFVAAFAAIAGYGVYSNQSDKPLSHLLVANVEALADAEIEGTNCDATWNQECCVCFHIHHTFAVPRTENGACEHRTGCSHY